MTSRKTLVTTLTVSMTTTTTPPILETDNGSDPQGSPKKTNNAQTAFHRHFVYDPQSLNPKWPLEMKLQEHGRWLGSRDEKQDQYDGQKPLRWPSEENQYNQDTYSKWLPDHISNDNRIGYSITGGSSNNNMNFYSNSGNNNCNYYNTNYIKDCDHLLRDQFIDHDFIASLSPPLPPPPPSSSLLMLNQEKMEGEVKDLSDVSSRGLKYPPPRRDSDGHILGSANYSAPSPPERDLTLPSPLTSEAHTRSKEKLSPLSSEPLKVTHEWKEDFDLDPYMLTNPTLSTTASNAYAWKENVDVMNENLSLSSSSYISKEVDESIANERNSRTLCNPPTSRPYIVKPKPFYNTSTQTEETELGYDSQLQFKVEENYSIPSMVSSVQPNLGLKSDQTYLEKATQVQLPKTSFVDRELVTLEQLRSPNHQEFIPASAPLLRKLTEEYYQMNISEDSNNDLTMNINHPQQPNMVIDEHLRDENKFGLQIRKLGTNNASQEHQLPFMNKADLNINKTFTQINEPLQPCVGKIGNISIDESIISANEQIQTYINLKKDSINDLNETNANIYEYERNVNECQSKPCSGKNQSVHIDKPQPQFNMDVKIDANINEQSLSVDEPKLQSLVGIKKRNLSISENSLNCLQPQRQSYREEPIDIHNLNASESQSKICKNIKSGLTIKENQLQSFRGDKNNIEPDYMNVNEQVADSSIRKKFGSVDDVFKEAKEFPKQVRGEPRLSGYRQEDPEGLLGMAAGVTAEIPDPFRLRVNNENFRSRVESAPEKLIQVTEGTFGNSEIRHTSNPENAFRQKEKDNPQTTVNKNSNFRSLKDRYKLNHETFLNQTRENVFNQPTENNCKNSESRYGTKFENQDQTRETKSPILQKKYASSSDILLNQTSRKNQSINSQTSGKRYENVFNQARESVFMQKTKSENLENRYGSSEKVGNQGKLTTSNLDIQPRSLSNYSQTRFGSVSDILNTPYITHHETQAAKPDLVTEKSKLTAEVEKSVNYPKQGFNTRCPSMDDQTFATFDDTAKTFENQSLIQHGRSESLPIDSTHENPSLQLRSYYSCTDVNKEKSSEPASLYGVSDYMDMSGRHQPGWPQICSNVNENSRSSGFVPTNTKKKRTSSCTSYRIHANFEFEEDPPPQLPPRAYRNMPENFSEDLNWIYESLRHRRSYANELRKQSRRLNICKPLANITEAHVTDINEMVGDKTNVDNTNIYAEKKDKGKERRKEKPKMPSVNSVKNETEKTLNNNEDEIENVEIISEDVKADLNIINTDMGDFKNIDDISLKYQQVDEVNITNIDKPVSIVSEHSSNNKCSPNINNPASNNLSSKVSQQSLNIDEQYLNMKEQNQSATNKKAMHIDASINTSEEYKHSASHIDDIKESSKTGTSSKENDIDIADVSDKTQDGLLQKEHNLNNSFEPNMHIREQESHLMSEDFNINKANQMYLKENCNVTNTDISDFTKTDESVNSKECVLHINENSANINEQKDLIKKETVQISSLTDLSKARPQQSIQSQNVRSPSQPELLFEPSPIFQNSVHKMSSPESSSNKLQFQYRSSSEQCLTSIGSCDDRMKIPLYVSLVNIPTEEAGFDSVAGKQHNIVSVKQRIHFFEYDSNGHLVRNRIPPPVPAKPTSLVLRKKFPKEEGFSPTQPSPETEQPPGKIFNFLTDKQSEASVDLTEEKSDQKCIIIGHVQYNINENMEIDADKVSLLLPEAKEVANDLEYFQQSQTFQDDNIDKEFLIRKKNALRDSLRRKLDVLRDAKLSVEAEIQEIDAMKKNICSQFENLCPNVNECRKLTDFFKDREMCQVLLSKLKVRITRLENEMKETRPSHDLHDKLSKLQTQYSDAEQLSSDIDARQNSLVRLMEKYLTETNLSDFNYLLVMRPRLVAEIFELNEKIYSGGQKLLELERVPYK